MRAFRDGQWCSWIGSVPGAHTTRNGRVVGVYHKARADYFGVEIPAQVYPVSKDKGEPLGGIVRLAFFVEQCQDISPVLDRKDLPQERLKNNPDWQPRP